MDNHHLRSLILKLQDRLSDSDRKRLHFFFGNDVPRRIRDDPTLTGTLNLMESLFDQDKINERDFTFLIDAFREIQCVDAVKFLRVFMALRNITPSSWGNILIQSTTLFSVRLDHKQRMQPVWLNEPTTTSVIPSLNEILDDQEDKSVSQNLLNNINTYGYNNKVIDSNNTNYNPVTINVDNKIMSSQSKQNQLCHISLRMNKYFFFMVMLLVMILGISMVIFISKSNESIKLDRKMRKEIILDEQIKQNRMIHSLNNTMSEKNKEITKLNIRITELEKEKDNFPIKAGQKFGGTNGIYFDDSSSSDFTCSHYLYGLVARNDTDGVESYQFVYRPSHDSYQQIQSPFHGNESFLQTYEWEFDTNEKINKVEGQFITKSFLSTNGTKIRRIIITGLQFSSTQNHYNPSYNGPSGTHFSESFNGYTLGYVTGRSGQYIEQIQFFWYRI